MSDGISQHESIEQYQARRREWLTAHVGQTILISGPKADDRSGVLLGLARTTRDVYDSELVSDHSTVVVGRDGSGMWAFPLWQVEAVRVAE